VWAHLAVAFDHFIQGWRIVHGVIHASDAERARLACVLSMACGSTAVRVRQMAMSCSHLRAEVRACHGRAKQASRGHGDEIVCRAASFSGQEEAVDRL
jgi:hypothetical protein